MEPMFHSDTPSPELLKEVRAVLVRRGTSLNAVAKAHGLHRQAVSAALSGKRPGPASRALAERFVEITRAIE